MANPLEPRDARVARMFTVRLVESPMPTGSRDPDILLAWLLDSMGLVRRKSDGFSIDDDQGALHRMMSQTFIAEPLKGWDAKSISEVSGLSQTGIHHQIVKLRESGIISTQTDDRWHVCTQGRVDVCINGIDFCTSQGDSESASGCIIQLYL